MNWEARQKKIEDADGNLKHEAGVTTSTVCTLSELNSKWNVIIKVSAAHDDGGFIGGGVARE